MRLFKINQEVFDLNKILRASYCDDSQRLILYFSHAPQLKLDGECAETVWILLCSLACDLGFKATAVNTPSHAELEFENIGLE